MAAGLLIELSYFHAQLPEGGSCRGLLIIQETLRTPGFGGTGRTWEGTELVLGRGVQRQKLIWRLDEVLEVC